MTKIQLLILIATQFLINTSYDLGHAQQSKLVYQAATFDSKTQTRKSHFFSDDFETAVGQYICLCRYAVGVGVDSFGFGLNRQNASTDHLFDDEGNASDDSDEMPDGGNIRCENKIVKHNIKNFDATFRRIFTRGCARA